MPLRIATWLFVMVGFALVCNGYGQGSERDRKEEYELQERCGKQAEEWFKQKHEELARALEERLPGVSLKVGDSRQS